MAQAPSELRMNVAEFLRWDNGTNTLYELVHGRPVAMSPASGRYAEIVRNLFRALDRQLRAPCRALVGGGVARDLENDEYRLPDIFVTCEPTPEYIFSSPKLVVEILSRSTEKDDRTTKLDFYKSLPSVEAVLLIWQDRRRVQLHVREEPRWPAQDFTGVAKVLIQSLSIELPLDEIYADMELPAVRADNAAEPGEV